MVPLRFFSRFVAQNRRFAANRRRPLAARDTVWGMDVFAIKPLDRILAESEENNALKRTLGPLALVALGVGAVVGAGIFTLTGVAAANYAGPALVISFVLAACGC